MSDLPERIIEAAARAHAGPGWWDKLTDHAEMLRRPYLADARNTLTATMDPALGPDRLVVAGPYEQEIIEKAAAWLERCARQEPMPRWRGVVNKDDASEVAWNLARELRRQLLP